MSRQTTDSYGLYTMNKLIQIVLSGLLLLLLSSVSSAEESVIYYHNDLLGSPVAATDEQGNLLWRESYKPYGEKLLNEQTASSYKLWYTGKAHDDDIGLSYFGARYYDPVVGRFMGIDPVGFVEANPTSFNRYAYANNNPYKYVDPDGRSAVTAFGGLIHESIEFAKGNGFNGAMVYGALKDGYNGEGGGFANAAFEDATSFIPTGAVAGALVKLSRFAKVTKSVTPNAAQASNLKRFQKKIPSNAKDKVDLRQLPNDGVAVQATSPGRVPGSKAVYEKQIDVNGKTVQATKTTYDPQGGIVHVKDKLNGGTYP